MLSTDNDYGFIHNKIVSYAEIVVCLFDHCNLKCVFCPQDHHSLEGTTKNEILSKIPSITHWINQNQKSQYFKLHLMGGELFQDHWIALQYLDIYQIFIDQITKATDPKKSLTFNFITNLVFNRREEVFNFLERNKLKISISYDPIGRFDKKQRSLFIDNVFYFKDRIEMVSVVLTKQTILAIQKGDRDFENLYQNFIIDFDHFLPSVPNSDALLPKESEKLAFFKFLIDHYPNCLTVAPFVEKEFHRPMTCTRGNSFTVLKDGTHPSGCSGSLFLKEGDRQYLETTQIVQEHLLKNECHTCEFYSQCPFPCFVSNRYKNSKNDLSTCLYQSLFTYTLYEESHPRLS